MFHYIMQYQCIFIYLICFKLSFCDQGLPCHLYFDLEFNKIENSNNNGEEMVDILLSLVFDFMNEKYSIEGDKECVVELDSSTEGIILT